MGNVHSGASCLLLPLSMPTSSSLSPRGNLPLPMPSSLLPIPQAGHCNTAASVVVPKYFGTSYLLRPLPTPSASLSSPWDHLPPPPPLSMLLILRSIQSDNTNSVLVAAPLGASPHTIFFRRLHCRFRYLETVFLRPRFEASH